MPQQTRHKSIELRDVPELRPRDRVSRTTLVAWLLTVGLILAFSGLGISYWIRHAKPLYPSKSQPIRISTYDGSGQLCHPTVIDFFSEYGRDQWGGYRYWMTATPYPNANDYYENPCVWASQDGINWIVPTGITNPLLGPPAQYRKKSHYRSDPCLAFDPTTNELVIFHRESYGSNASSAVWIHRTSIVAERAGESYVYAVTQKPKVVGPFSRSQSLVSPSVVIDANGIYHMWAVGSRATDRTASTADTPNTTKSSSREILYSQSVSGSTWSSPKICAPTAKPQPTTLNKNPLQPWHVTAKLCSDGQTVQLLVNTIQASERSEGTKSTFISRILATITRTRFDRALYWAESSLDEPLSVSYSPQPLMASDGASFPYRSAFVPANKSAGSTTTPTRLWLGMYSNLPVYGGGAQTWGITTIELPNPNQRILFDKR